MKRGLVIGAFAAALAAAGALCLYLWAGREPAMTVRSLYLAQPHITTSMSAVQYELHHLEAPNNYRLIDCVLEYHDETGWRSVSSNSMFGLGDFYVEHSDIGIVLNLDEPMQAGNYRLSVTIARGADRWALHDEFIVSDPETLPPPAWNANDLTPSPRADTTHSADASLAVEGESSGILHTRLRVRDSFTYGTVFTLETQLEGRWYEVPVPANMGFTLPLYEISPQSAPEGREITYQLNGFGVLPAGDYRIVQPLTLQEGGDVFVWADFSLAADIYGVWPKK